MENTFIIYSFHMVITEITFLYWVNTVEDTYRKIQTAKYQDATFHSIFGEHNPFYLNCSIFNNNSLIKNFESTHAKTLKFCKSCSWFLSGSDAIGKASPILSSGKVYQLILRNVNILFIKNWKISKQMLLTSCFSWQTHATSAYAWISCSVRQGYV